MLVPSSDIRSHTGLRGIAALMIVALHYGHDLKPIVDLHSATGIIGIAGVYVDLFFMLSGFIMIACYGDQFATRLNGTAVRDYWIKRFARIYPLHLLTLLWMAVFDYKISGLVVSDVIENLLLIHAWGMNNDLVLNAVSWSISAEAFLYLGCPLMIFLLSRRWGWLAVGLVAAACYGWLLLRADGLAFNARLPLLRAVPAFVIGLMLGASRHRVGQWSTTVVSVMQLGALAVLLVLLHLHKLNMFLIVGFAVLILSTADDRGPVARVLSCPAMQWLGVMSYAIYMLHMPVRQVVYAFAARALPGADPDVFALVLVVACTIGTLLAAPVLYHWFEMPLRRWIVARPRRTPRTGRLRPA